MSISTRNLYKQQLLNYEGSDKDNRFFFVKNHSWIRKVSFAVYFSVGQKHMYQNGKKTLLVLLFLRSVETLHFWQEIFYLIQINTDTFKASTIEH